MPGMFVKAIGLYEPFKDAWFKLGVAYRPLGRTEWARKCWLRVLELDAKHTLTLMNLANLEFEADKRKRALELWDAALETNPDLTQALVNKGAALADDGDLNKAFDLFSAAASKGHKAAEQVLALSRIYRDMDPALGPVQMGHSFLFSVSTGNALDMNIERSRRLAPLLDALGLEKAGYHAFRHFNVSLMDALRVPLKTIQERIGHALTGSFTLDVYGHTLDWKSSEEAAKGLGSEIAKAMKEAEGTFDSGPLTAHKENDPQTRNLEVVENT